MKSLLLILSNSRYFAPALVFASLNVWFGTWAIYIPWVKEKFAIDKAQLGITLFFLSFGVFTVFPFAANWINRFGVGKATWLGVILCSVTALGPFVAPSYELLCLALFCFGVCNGFLDISMNTLVAEIEKEDQQHFMSSAHGFFSLGGVVVGLQSFFVDKFPSPVIHMLVNVVLVLVVNLFFFKQYLKIIAAPVIKKKYAGKFYKPLLILGVVGIITMGSEGAIIDWSSLFLKEVTKAPERLIGAGFFAFSVAMTVGRFLGDGISSKVGSTRIILLGGLIAILGYTFVLSSNTYLAILGFALNGMGFSVIVPELFRIGGKLEGVESSKGVAFIAGMGYFGFLLGPVVLGFMAETFNLLTSFMFLLVAVFIVLLSIYNFNKIK